MIIDTESWHWPQWLLIWGFIFDFFGALILMKANPTKNWLLHVFFDNLWVFVIVIAGGFFK